MKWLLGQRGSLTRSRPTLRVGARRDLSRHGGFFDPEGEVAADGIAS